MARITLQKIAVMVSSLILAGTLFSGWAKLQYSHEAESQIADQFVKHLRASELTQAFELTTKATTWGYGGESFEKFAPRQLCGAFQIKSVFPFQSNGNRLVRVLKGHGQDISEVNVLFEGECFFEVLLQREYNGLWKVVRFGSTAG